ncbi:MAG: hypothetical protein IH628_11605 [Proteobacteria bacterium]|nr:hypothetical protein [Pseudomonadota bacterium]
MEVSLSTWFNTSPEWHLNVYGGYTKTYNFRRHYLAYYSWMGVYFEWNTTDILELGATLDTFVEGNPANQIEDITYNTRPFVSVTPINDLNLRMYLDIVYTRSSQQIQRTILGFLFAYNFLPKSWIYFAVNEYRDRPDVGPIEVRDRAGVLKIQYLYYF